MFHTTDSNSGATRTVSLDTGQPGGIFAITVGAQAQAVSQPSTALCQVSLDGTPLDVQQLTVPGTSTTGGRTITLVGTGTASAATGGGVVLVQCSDSGGTIGAINVQATQVAARN